MLIVFPLNFPSRFAQSELPLVGNVAPDFEAEAVYDQEFIKVVYQWSMCVKDNYLVSYVMVVC